MPTLEDQRSNPLLAMTAPWLELWQHAGAASNASLAAVALLSDYRKLRNWWLADMTQTMDRYMRSSPFLDLMQLNLRSMTRSASLMFPLLR